MEMISGCPPRPVRGPHGGWHQREIDALRQRITQAEQSGESLRSVFEEMGERLGRKPNSIRNFYYAQLRTQQDERAQRALPFETFTQAEIEQLIRSVLTARAQGRSVRACVRELSGGDRSRMLRYQNKYRSVVRARPELVERIMAQLREEGVPFVSPYPQEDAQQALCAREQALTRAQRTQDTQIAQLFSSLDHLLALAFDRPQETAVPDAALRRADRLKAQLDVTRIALDDEKTRAHTLRSEAQGMVTVLKEFIALPEQERPARCAAFCREAAARLSAVECALMQE